MTIKISQADQQLQYAADSKPGDKYSGIAGVKFTRTHAVATNGRILAVRCKSSEVTDQVLKFKSPNQVGTKANREKYTITETGALAGVETDKKGKPRNSAEILDGKFVTWQNPVRDMTGAPFTVTIKIDAKLLHDLALALSDNGNTFVDVEIPLTNKPIEFMTAMLDGEENLIAKLNVDTKKAFTVVPSVSNEASRGFGLIMPLSDGGSVNPAERMAEILKTETQEEAGRGGEEPDHD